MATRQRRPGATDTRKAQGAGQHGRPALERERVVKTVVVLLARQVSALDRLSIDIRDASGRSIGRSDILRGIVEGVLASGVDLTEAVSETEIAELISARLRR